MNQMRLLFFPVVLSVFLTMSASSFASPYSNESEDVETLTFPADLVTQEDNTLIECVGSEPSVHGQPNLERIQDCVTQSLADHES